MIHQVQIWGVEGLARIWIEGGVWPPIERRRAADPAEEWLFIIGEPVETAPYVLHNTDFESIEAVRAYLDNRPQ